MMETIEQNTEQLPNEASDKTISQQNPTRHPTTNKKQRKSPESFRRSAPFEMSPPMVKRKCKSYNKRSCPLLQSLTMLESQKLKSMKSGSYNRALSIEQQIKRTKSLLNKSQMRKMKNNQIKQKQSIKKAYLFEIKFFQNAWSNYFEQFKEREQSKLMQFKINQRYDIDTAREKLRRKCYTLKSSSRQINDLEKQERYYLRTGDVKRLADVRKQVKEEIQKTNKEREATIIRWTKVEEKQLERKQEKKYNSLLRKLQEERLDQEQLYVHERKRLKQKYKNVLNQLKHEQRMTMQCFVNNWLKPLKSV